MTRQARVGLLGGTFDPIHMGHLAVASAARQALGLDAVLLLPNRVPPHRPLQPAASVFHRFAMTALAALSLEGLQASDLDLQTSGPSFTADLLERLHAAGLQPSQIVFILGGDAFADIAKWYRYPEVLDGSHFAVISRPGRPASGMREAVPALAARFIDVPRTGGTPEPARVQTQLAASQTSVFLIDAPTPEISSTMIRERVGRGEAIASLVPAEVARYIARHGLYRANPPSGRSIA